MRPYFENSTAYRKSAPTDLLFCLPLRGGRDVCLVHYEIIIDTSFGGVVVLARVDQVSSHAFWGVRFPLLIPVLLRCGLYGIQWRV